MSATEQAPLPVRDGVAPSYVWLPAGPWRSLMAFLRERFPAVEESAWIARMARGEVLNQRGECMTPDSAYRCGDRIFYYREPGAETPIPFVESILYRDANLLVADKPHFLPVVPSGRFGRETLLARLRLRTGLEDLAPIHRLDRETAGVVMFSIDRASRGLYQALFRERRVDKVYEALAVTRDDLRFPLSRQSRLVPGEPFFCMREAIGEPNAHTRIELIERRGAHSLYRLWPATGKQHQLRVHMAALGMPIINDGFYPLALPCKGDDFSAPLQLLARSISFIDPISGREMIFRSERELSWPSAASPTEAGIH